MYKIRFLTALKFTRTILPHLICKTIVIFLAISLFFLQAEVAGESRIPFHTGEKLTFELKWEVIPAGKAVLEVFPNQTINAIETRHFGMRVKTNKFVDVFYKVREQLDTYTDVGLHHSVLYTEKHIAGNTKKDLIVSFDWDRHTAQYTNFGKKRKPITIPPGTFDPLAAFYFSRRADLYPGGVIQRPITDGKKCVFSTARVIKKEQITVPAGTFETYLIEPELKDVGGVFKKSKHAKIQLWITADSRRMPVKIKSRVVVGSFMGELIAVE
ncbi:MAG: DUF3108 domain-containing protein [Deltaproteobacteria bacterium]|nr:DUF3108 domain-containing protein [Deltaproteobacteria bacterium]